MAFSLACAQRSVALYLQMLKLNRAETMQQIHELAEYRGTHIVAMTADAIAENKAECLKAGLKGFLMKPFNPMSFSRSCCTK